MELKKAFVSGGGFRGGGGGRAALSDFSLGSVGTLATSEESRPPVGKSSSNKQNHQKNWTLRSLTDFLQKCVFKPCCSSAAILNAMAGPY